MNHHTSTSTNEDEPIVQTVSEPLQKVLKEAPGLQSEREPPQTKPFHPQHRQPLAMLTILDDGRRDEGETIRIRQQSLTIGREKGDVTLPFDTDVSAQHAELRCQYKNGKYRWYLIDLASTNGTFLRAYRATLTKSLELLFGNRLYQLQLPKQETEPVSEPAIVETNRYKAPVKTERDRTVPKLIEMGVDNGQGRSFHLTGTELLLGRESSCQMAIPDDPYLSPTHARFRLDKRGRWRIEDQKSLNGIWVKVKKIPLDQQAEFQIGQQRFCFRPQTG